MAKPSQDQIDAYLKEVIEVGKKHSLSISHQDGNGSFEVAFRDSHCTSDYNDDWMREAVAVETPELPRQTFIFKTA